MGKPVVEILDNIHCRANKFARPVIRDCLKYETTSWQKGDRSKGEYGMQQKLVEQSLITGRTGTSGKFLTGLLPRVKKHYRKNGGRLIIKGELEKVYPIEEPNLKGITFRPDQLEVLRKIKRKHRGRIVFPTGSGKTVIGCGIISMFPDCRHLVLCHTRELVKQWLEVFDEYEFDNVYAVGAGHKFRKAMLNKDEAILIATIQSYVKWHHLLIDYFEVTIIDELHHANSLKSQYGKVLQLNLAPRKYGLTATKPTTQKKVLVNEGLLGPDIAELTVQRGIQLGIIAKPKINLVAVPYEVKINQKCSTYSQFYDRAIVRNKIRNQSIVDEVKLSLGFGHITLIVIEKIKHGKLIQKQLRKNGIKAPFVHGGTKNSKRSRIKDRLKSKKLHVAICSRVWKEGINIPALNHIIAAAGMKDEKGVIQTIGRGLRTTVDKDTIRLTDFLDPYKFLSGHSIMRMQVYSKQGWL